MFCVTLRTAIIEREVLMRNIYIIFILLLFTVGLQAQIKNVGIGAENKELESIKLYPNPTSDFVIFHLPERQSLKEVAIYNITGKQVSRQNTNKVDLRSFPAGTYILKVSLVDGESVMRKVIKK